jgi:pSer/pThr/pTyr-binding forkhead associated (FHA) protein
MSLRLIIEDDEGSTTIVPLGKEAVTIGRQQGNTIQLTEKNVSRRHARLMPEGEVWVLEDLGSYNGVKVNGRAVEGRVSLREGDVVQIGDYHLALTEDVERRSLNYDRPRTAANDVEPMLASSSTNLPRLSPDELAALSSGQHVAAPPPPPPILVDSGQIPMARPQPAAYPAEERQKKGAGALIAAGLLGIGAIALGGFWLASNTGDKNKDATTIATAATENRADAKATPAATKPSEPTKPEVVAVAPDPVPPEPTPPTPVPPTPSEANPPPEAEGPPVVVEPDTPTPPPVEKKEPKKPPPDKKEPKKPAPAATTPKTPPPTPAAPPADAAQLLADARMANMKGNSSKAYDLASQAWAAGKSQDAAVQMAIAACKMGDAGKAKKAIGKLKGSRRDDAVKLCAGKGIVVE